MNITDLLIEQNELYKELIAISKTLKYPLEPISRFLSDKKKLDLYLVHEGLNINNTFEYIQVEENSWMIDIGVRNAKRLCYLVSVVDNELAFSLVDIPKEFQDLSKTEVASLEMIISTMKYFSNKKGDDFYQEILKYETQNLNLSSTDVKKLFNTIYKIVDSYLETSPLDIIFFKALKNENSKISLYDFLYKLLLREERFIEYDGDYEILDDKYEYYIFKVK